MKTLMGLTLAVTLLPATAQVPAPAPTAPAAVPAKPKAAPATPESIAYTDPLLRPMAEEIERSSRLRVLDPLYYLEYSVDDAELYSASASMGALVREMRNRIRSLRVSARVGAPAFDSGNSIFTDFYSGSRYDSDSLPLDNNNYALRHALWLATDRAYKGASEAISRKRAALRGVTVSDPMPDFSPAPRNRLFLEVKNSKIDEAGWVNRTKSLSSVYLTYPQITASTVDFQSAQGGSYYVNSEGSVVRFPDKLAIVQTRASLQTADGATVYDGLSVQSLDISQLPSETALRGLVDEVAKNVVALGNAPRGDTYLGPVLFEPRAAAQVFAEIFGSSLAIMRRPVSEPGRALPIPASEMEGRLGSRVLPEWMHVTDDPTRKDWNGRPLIGFYVADLEGQPPKPVSLVENGVLKNFLMTRTPVRGATETNGHARLPGAFGARTARFGNLMVTPLNPVPFEDLKKRMIEMIKQQGKPYGMMVRKMDFPSAALPEEFRRIASRVARSGGASSRPISSPILVYRIYPDGREELVRGLRFRNFGVRSFRDIVAASREQALFDYLENGAPFALMSAGNFVVGSASIAPGVLFEELELERPEEELPKLPVVPPPSL